MGALDAELYLRMAGERELIAGSAPGPIRGQTLFETASALVAVGALEPQRAQEVLDEYVGALALRDGPAVHALARRTGSAKGTRSALTPGRVATFEPATVQCRLGTMQLRYVSLGARSTTIAVLVASQSMHGRVFEIELTDDRGSLQWARLNGGGRIGTGWQGRLQTMHPLSPTTRWIAFDGCRAELRDGAPPPPPAVEAVERGDPAEDYLRSRLTAGRHGPHGGPHPPLLEVAIATLLDAGALAPENPVIGEARQVLAAFSGQQPSADLGEPWSSLLRTATPSTRSATVPFGQVTPPISGVEVRLEALTVTDGVAELFVEMAWERAGRPPAMALEVDRIAWWASDDLGHSYLGARTNWGAGDGIEGGVVSFWPALDPKTRLLRLLVTGAGERAVVEVELPGEPSR